ncbi:hypothetical protein PoB_004272700 [Plakobranchus ocellatus]|uniref:Uncharacterized protein n=1 Tax=Plakobranchus ocellatus TaxID=259542 RepID=A0AAV4B9Y0_9GAST|nr:hypothetical protein PoB_004272700 [Plakobranchus ocellatus]
MGSSLLKLSVLLLCLAFVLSAPLENKKYRSSRFIKRVDNFFSGVGKLFTEGDKDKDRNKKPSLTFDEQAENVLMGQFVTRETAKDLAEQGEHLKTYSLTLEDLDKEERESVADFLRTLAHQAIDIAELVIENSEAISEALIDSVKDVEDVVKSSATELGLAMEHVDKSIIDAEEALKKIGTPSENPEVKSVSKELEETMDKILDATQSIANVGAYSAKFEEKAEKAGKDLVEVLARAADRIAQSVSVTG